MHRILDVTCFTASLLCCLHCLALPAIVVLLPIIGVGWIADEFYEHLFLLTSAILAILSLCWGLKKHRKYHPLAILSAGLSLMVIAHLWLTHDNPWSTILAVLGGLTIALSHYINYRLCEACTKCNHSHSHSHSQSHFTQGKADATLL